MIRLSNEDVQRLQEQSQEISHRELKKNWEEFMELTPIHSGSPQEEEAVHFIKEKLKDYNLEPQVLHYDAYLSDPKWARLKLIEPRKIDVQCTPYRQVGSTGPHGIEGEVIYLAPEEIGQAECRGKIVLAEQVTAGDWMGLRYQLLLKLQEMGVKGLIVIEQDTFMPTVIHQRADFSVSGNPTTDNIHLIQTIPAIVSVCNKDGQLLKNFVKQGNLRVHLTSIVETGWKTLPLLVAEIRGNREKEKFMLVNGHVDTPPFSPGVTDNASGVVAMLDLARIFQKHRDRLGRSIRFVFWTGHEIGRYAGSTWYNDAFWHDLRYNCIGSLNIDSPGADGATTYRAAPVAEIQDVALESINAASGLEVKKFRWLTRAGDGSFWGTGFPHTSITSARPKETYDRFVNYSGGGWWWHTAWATLDRGDVDVLATDVNVNLNCIFRMTNCRILPMNFVPYAEEMVKILEEIQAKSDKVRGYFNLHSVIDKAKEFKNLTQSLEAAALKAADRGSDNTVDELNHCLMWISRYINPVAHSDVEKTHQMDMETFGAKPFPRIHGVLDLANMPLHQSAQFKFLQTKLLREKNYVEDGFYLANELIRQTLVKIQGELS